MRPLKRVLLYCTDIGVTQEMRLLLHVWGYQFDSCISYGEAIAAAREAYPHGWDAVLVVAITSVDALDLAKLLKRVSPGIRVVELRKKMSMVQTLADAVIFEGAGNADLRETLRIVAYRKRGPKKDMQQVAA